MPTLKKTGEKKKIKIFLVATNVIASHPAERQPTGTPTARAQRVHKILTPRVSALLGWGVQIRFRVTLS